LNQEALDVLLRRLGQRDVRQRGHHVDVTYLDAADQTSVRRLASG
jgi:hypothetical protein